MMGRETVAEIREYILKSFAKKGLNAIESLEAEIAKLEKTPEDNQGAIKALLNLRDALAKAHKKGRRARRSVKAK